MAARKRSSLGAPVTWLVAAFAGFVASLALIGGDALWLVPLGHDVAHGRLPGSIPFATAATSGWHDVPAGAELVFWALYHGLGGYRGLVLAQVAAAAVGFGALASGLRREATDGAVLLVSMLVLAGSLTAVVIAGNALFSLALFPLLLLLLQNEARVPSGRVWLSVPLLAAWGNLHGEVLAGWALLACYLVLDRARRQAGTAAAVLGAATLALFANPALWRTALYYRGIFGSEVARHGEQLWAPLGASGLDVLLIAVAVLLGGLILWRGPSVRLWEGVALAGLLAGTIHVSRTGTWLLFVAAYPASRSLRLGAPRARLLAVAAAVLIAGALLGVAKGPLDPGSKTLAARAAATGRPVLATGLLGEQVALDGGRVWVSNPIDAFRRRDQRLYLDWLSGKRDGASAVMHAAYVLVAVGSAPARIAARDAGLVRLAADRKAVLYRVRRPASNGRSSGR